MPELPEVETIRRGLQQHVVGHMITAIDIRLPKQFKGDPTHGIGAKIQGVRRFGKGLVVDLDNGYSLAIHVKMTGQLLYKQFVDARGPVASFPPVGARSREASFNELRAVGIPSSGTTPRSITQLPDKYTHVVFSFDNNAALYYRDMRQFGWIHVVKTEDVIKLPFFQSLGPEPLRDLTFALFEKLLERKTPIKVLLMDQSKIAGIGNIYANDALFRAKIDPRRSASTLLAAEKKALFAAIEEVLQKGIEVGGASQWHYVDVLGGKGKYQNFFLVYQKAGKPCPRCGSLIQKITLGGRGTFFCPTCQT
jgi:formamidopyrimidine-DNA glycosylase